MDFFVETDGEGGVLVDCVDKFWAWRVLAGYVLEVFAFSVGEVREFVGYLLRGWG